jgi:polyhydroxybutyrate depolymerase
VYLAGYSNGGRMALRLACDAPGLFAAVAAVEAVPVYTCPRPPPVSLLEIASSDDPLLAVDAAQPQKVVNGFAEPDVASVVASWRQVDGCRDQSSSSTTGTLTQTRWSGCHGGTKVEYALYHGGSHAWPAGAAASDTPSAEGVIWSFFTGPRGGAG